jgi:hypothetical protein
MTDLTNLSTLPIVPHALGSFQLQRDRFTKIAQVALIPRRRPLDASGSDSEMQ